MQVFIPNDADNDGIPDECGIANGLNLRDASDAGQGADGGGLRKLQGFQHGTKLSLPAIPESSELEAW